MKSLVFRSFLISLGAILLGPSSWALDPYRFSLDSPLHLGSNYDPMDLMTVKAQCLSSIEGRRVQVAPPNTIYSSTLVRDTRDLYEKMNFDAKVGAQAGIGPITFGKASFERAFNTESRFRSNSVTWAVTASSNYGIYQLKNDPPVSLLPEMRKLMVEDPEQFAVTCGTEYIQSEIREVRIIALFTAYTADEDSANELKNSFGVSGGYGWFSSSASADYRNWVKSVLSRSSVQMTIYTLGGGGVVQLSDAPLASTSMDEIKTVISSYMKGMGPENAVATQLFRSSMTDFQWKAGAGALTGIQLSIWDRTLTRIFYLYQDLNEIAGKAFDIAKNPLYPESERKEMSEVYSSVSASIQSLSEAVDTCRLTPKSCAVPPGVKVPTVSWPKALETAKAPQWRFKPLFRYHFEKTSQHRTTTQSNLPPGWIMDGIEGYILAEPYPGTVPLYGVEGVQDTRSWELTPSEERARGKGPNYRFAGIEGYVYLSRDLKVSGLVDMHVYYLPLGSDGWEDYWYVSNPGRVAELTDRHYGWTRQGVVFEIFRDQSAPAPQF